MGCGCIHALLTTVRWYIFRFWCLQGNLFEIWSVMRVRTSLNARTHEPWPLSLSTALNACISGVQTYHLNVLICCWPYYADHGSCECTVASLFEYSTQCLYQQCTGIPPECLNLLLTLLCWPWVMWMWVGCVRWVGRLSLVVCVEVLPIPNLNTLSPWWDNQQSTSRQEVPVMRKVGHEFCLTFLWCHYWGFPLTAHYFVMISTCRWI